MDPVVHLAFIHKLQAELYDNAHAIPSPLGGGANSHLGLLMPNAKYTAIAGTANVGQNT